MSASGTSSHHPLLVVVGGFLGAGKTTTIQAAAAHLRGRGRRVAIVANDQSSELFDTAMARRGGTPVAEIPDGCFCCQYDALVDTLAELARRHAPDVVLAEAVGSCTDLAATVLQPMRQLGQTGMALAPLTVIADGLRLRDRERGAAGIDMPPDIAWLHDRQLAEADVILLNKVDQLHPAEVDAIVGRLRQTCPEAEVVPISGRDGTGIAGWADRLAPSATAGERVLTIDYDRYADAEAQLGWVNLSGEIQLGDENDAAGWIRALLDRVQARAAASGYPVAHVKVSIVTDAGGAIGQLTSTTPEPWIATDGLPAGVGALIVNARAPVEPSRLHAWIGEGCDRADAMTGNTLTIRQDAAIRPGRPVPVHRLQPVQRHGLAPPG